ncbi:MAG: hypothetical protein H0X42_07955 [Solirubrobacterales bacterium]|nr:hypothetical protein [Solirubrobacterales bacterium]
MSGHETIRSYQRIFRPERRLHQIEGRALPVPGGVPLRWLGYAGASLLAVLMLAAGSVTIYVGLAVGAAIAGAAVGRREGAAVAGISALAGSWLGGHVLGLLDWPLRLVVIPAGVATLGTQATPDGRRADRFALSWLALRLSPRRRSLGRALPPEDTPRVEDASVWVAPDEHSPTLRAGRVRGEGTIAFSTSIAARRSRLRQRRMLVRVHGGRGRRAEIAATRLAVADGETVEVRP